MRLHLDPQNFIRKSVISFMKDWEDARINLASLVKPFQHIFLIKSLSANNQFYWWVQFIQLVELASRLTISARYPKQGAQGYISWRCKWVWAYLLIFWQSWGDPWHIDHLELNTVISSVNV